MKLVRTSCRLLGYRYLMPYRNSTDKAAKGAAATIPFPDSDDSICLFSRPISWTNFMLYVTKALNEHLYVQGDVNVSGTGDLIMHVAVASWLWFVQTISFDRSI